MEFGVSKVDRDLVKKWAYLFCNYLQPSANPPR